MNNPLMIKFKANRKGVTVRRNILLFKKKFKRKLKKQIERAGYEKYMNDVRKIHPNLKNGKNSFRKFQHNSNKSPKPSHLENVTYFQSIGNAFAPDYLRNSKNIFYVPEVFSLSENYSESSTFIKKLYNALLFQSYEEIVIDYQYCNEIGVAASVCMDIVLSDFIKYYEKCTRQFHEIKVKEITPINFEKHNIRKILFSIGAFKNIKGFNIDFENIIPYPLCIGDKNIKESPSIREVHITQLVDYIIGCLQKMNRNLTPDAEDDLYKVIGEVMINAEEHSNTKKRYSVGYFESTKTTESHFGVFNLAIINFGNTFYETFKGPNCKNYEIVKNMESLSENFTMNKLFRKSKFEEETLWTLYALQEGVTSKPDWKRGNGSIRFIESFFNLKGNSNFDYISKMSIISGHTKIIFNGEYQTVQKERGKERKIYKMMTFNNSGNIEELPDERYVTYNENFFPGTLIVAKIYIDFQNTENIEL